MGAELCQRFSRCVFIITVVAVSCDDAAADGAAYLLIFFCGIGTVPGECVYCFCVVDRGAIVELGQLFRNRDTRFYCSESVFKLYIGLLFNISCATIFYGFATDVLAAAAKLVQDNAVIIAIAKDKVFFILCSSNLYFFGYLFRDVFTNKTDKLFQRLQNYANKLKQKIVVEKKVKNRFKIIKK